MRWFHALSPPNGASTRSTSASYGSLPATQIAGHVDTGARTITLDLRGAQVPMEQATVSFFSVLRASY